MADSSIRPNYYCHACEAEIVPNLQDFTCPSCHSGFIEEIPAGNSDNGFTTYVCLSATFITKTVQPTFDTFNFLQNLLGEQFTDGAWGLSQEPDEEEMIVEEDVEEPRQRRAGRRSNGRGQNGSRSGVEHFTIQVPGRPSVVSTRVRLSGSDNPFLLQFLSGVESNFDSLQGDIRNYALNPTMFDNLITLLMNQLQVGPPPASDAAIAELPVIKLTEELVEKYKTCSICFDDYQLSEDVTRLPCQHVYHTTCVNTWLKQHATCPICRKDLSGRDTSQMEGPTNSRVNANTSSGSSNA
ncbi:unnamed protein product [Calicophoron daubneyi]|uniref:RING-type E3 ubiquitin transferase n=1 Tax=Calicophoron daubneyi TaxID=300641 RepID=A0AAV2T3X1_CALDB